VLGSEATGLSKVWVDVEINTVNIPMYGLADSLNISNAAAVLFYEAQRQRLQKPVGPLAGQAPCA